MFRRHGLGNFHELVVELSRDPAMIFWLDNCESTVVAPNENYGRELLELFSMGIGNYAEDDVKAAARAFMEADPAVVSGQMTATLHPYAVALLRK